MRRQLSGPGDEVERIARKGKVEQGRGSERIDVAAREDKREVDGVPEAVSRGSKAVREPFSFMVVTDVDRGRLLELDHRAAGDGEGGDRLADGPGDVGRCRAIRATCQGEWSDE